MLLAYIDSIEQLVASAHAQMQIKQAHFFFAIFFLEKICVGPCFFATVVVTPMELIFYARACSLYLDFHTVIVV